jgi:hypothetical protein
MGWQKEVEVISGVCAQGTFFGLYEEIIKTTLIQDNTFEILEPQ